MTEGRRQKTEDRRRMAKTICLLLAGCWLLIGSAFAKEVTFEIRAKKFSYTPSIIKVNKGDEVRVRLMSEDVHHGFYLDGYEIKTSARPGMDGNLKFIANKTGKFAFRCSVTCGEFHPYMIGTLIVRPNTCFNFFAGLIIILGIANLSFIYLRKQG